MKKWIFVLFALGASILPQQAIYRVEAKSVPQTILSGKNWAYSVPFEVHNPEAIEKLISCESQGINISRPDSNGRDSDGILQFNRDRSNLLGSGTWAWMESLSGLKGSPIIPADAIRMADYAIDHGLIGHWSCARIMKLIP